MLRFSLLLLGSSGTGFLVFRSIFRWGVNLGLKINSVKLHPTNYKLHPGSPSLSTGKEVVQWLRFRDTGSISNRHCRLPYLHNLEAVAAGGGRLH